MVDSDLEASEPDISDDDIGVGLHGESPEEIQRIEIDADVDASPQPVDQQTGTKRKLGECLSAPVWVHFIQGVVQSDKSYSATCKYCGKVYPMGNQKGTGNMTNHIDRGCKKIPASKRHKPDALQRLLQAGRDAAGQTVVAPWVFDQKKCRNSFARCVIAHEYPFNCGKHHFLKVFLSDLCPEFKLPSRYTIRLDCLKVYEEERLMLYDMLGNIDCKISFTSDLWSSKGRDRGFMSLTCHFIDENWKLRKRILTFCPLETPHTGKVISQAIYGKLVEWNLDKRIFSLVLDNSSTNDAAVKDLLTTSIRSVLPADGAIFHLRCGCHILNLIVQDGLNVLSGQITKVRESMKYIRHSQGRMEKFILAAAQVHAPDKKPTWNVKTRWNSTFMMLELALELKEAINRYALSDRNFTCCPTEVEWQYVEGLVPHLKVFYEVTNKFSGTLYPTINFFWPEYCEIFLTIKRMSTSPFPFVVDMSKEMFKKCDKYWKDGNILLAVACVLDPRCKLHVEEYYFKMLHPDECPGFMANLRSVLNHMFKEYSDATSNQTQANTSNNSMRSVSSPSASGSSTSISETRAGLQSFLSGMRTNEPTRSELEEYLSDALDGSSLDASFDILSWWRLKAHKYPTLARLTKDVLSVPMSTVASESTFSTAGRTLSPIRSKLNNESLQALICAQDWLRASITETGGIFGDVIWSSDEAE